MIDWLKGKKTDLLAAIGALSLIVEFVAAGNFAPAAIFDFVQLMLLPGIAATFRAGVGKVTTNG